MELLEMLGLQINQIYQTDFDAIAIVKMWSRLHLIIIMFKVISIKSFITFYTFLGKCKISSKSLPNEARTREIFLQNVSSYGLIFQFPLQQQIGRVFIRHSAKPQLRSFPSVRQPWNTTCHPIPSFKTFPEQILPSQPRPKHLLSLITLGWDWMAIFSAGTN